MKIQRAAGMLNPMRDKNTRREPRGNVRDYKCGGQNKQSMNKTRRAPGSKKRSVLEAESRLPPAGNIPPVASPVDRCFWQGIGLPHPEGLTSSYYLVLALWNDSISRVKWWGYLNRPTRLFIRHFPIPDIVVVDPPQVVEYLYNVDE